MRGGDTCEVGEGDEEEKARRLKEEERLCLAILFFLLILAPRALVTAATRSMVDPETRIGSDPKQALLSPFTVTPSTPAMKARASFFSWTTTPWSIIIRVFSVQKRKSNWWYWSNLNKRKGRDQQAVVFALDFSERLLCLWSKLPVKDARQSRNGGWGGLGLIFGLKRKLIDFFFYFWQDFAECSASFWWHLCFLHSCFLFHLLLPLYI